MLRADVHLHRLIWRQAKREEIKFVDALVAQSKFFKTLMSNETIFKTLRNLWRLTARSFRFLPLPYTIVFLQFLHNQEIKRRHRIVSLFSFKNFVSPLKKILLRRMERGILLRSGDSYKAFEDLFWFVREASRQLRKFSFLFLRFIGLAKTKTKKKLRRKKEIRGVFL